MLVDELPMFGEGGKGASLLMVLACPDARNSRDRLAFDKAPIGKF